MESNGGENLIISEWIDTERDGPQTVYCDNYPRCHVKRNHHGRKEEIRPTKIATGTFGSKVKFRVKCHQCKHWNLVDFTESR